MPQTPQASPKSDSRSKSLAKSFGRGLTEVILALFETFDDVYTYMIFDHYHRRRGFGNYQPKKAVVYSTLNRLKQQGELKITKKNGKTAYKLTTSGKTKLLARQAFDKQRLAMDGLSTVVIFDIPEEHKAQRAYLRRLLLQNGFINLQRSVLVGKLELSHDFINLLEDLKIKPYVTILKSKILHY